MILFWYWVNRRSLYRSQRLNPSQNQVREFFLFDKEPTKVFYNEMAKVTFFR